MRAGKARIFQASLSTTTPSARRQVITSHRCICAFSTTCKSSQHDQPSTDANVSYYDRLWAGLTPGGSNLKSTTSGRKQQQHPSPTSGTEHQAASSPKYTLPYKNRPNWLSDKSPLDSPSFSKRTSESYDAPASGGEKASSHFKMMTASTSTKSQESSSKATRTPLSTRVNTSQTLNEANETFDSPASASPLQSSSSSPSGEGVSWADLLAKIQKTRGGSYPSLPTNYQYTDPPRAQKPVYKSPTNSSWTTRGGEEESTTKYQQQTRRQAAPSTSSSPLSHVDTALHEKIFDSQAESRRYSLTLQEEIRYLSSPAQALKWMQDRLFSKTNEDSLMYKLDSNSQTSNTEELQYLYGDLLVDVTHYLRTSSTSLPSGATSSSTTRQMAFLPLILAKEHSTKSYLYGCTPKLYALNIRMKWEDHGDIQGVLELLQEMERGAVHLNMAIQDYVKNISLAVMADRLRAQREVEAERREKEKEEKEAAKANSAVSSQSQSDQEEIKGVENEPRQDEEDTSIASAQAEKASTHQPFSFASKYIIEKHIESKLFFSNAQRRALREIERIVVEDRKKYFEYRDREDNSNDNILSRSSSPSSVSSRFASPQYEGVDKNGIEGAERGQEEEQMSEVNALIESYGRAVPLLSTSSSSTITSPAQYAHEQYQQQQQQQLLSSSRDSPRSYEDAIIPDVNGMSNDSFDVLNQAVSEASEVKPKKIRKQGTSSWSKKGKKTLSADRKGGSAGGDNAESVKQAP